jgi:opacity protein-like surface antigen
VDSLRKEDGRTVHLTQIHVDGGLSVTYAITRNVLLEAGYNYTYFFQHETSREDDNAFELSDNGFRFGLSVAF